jgi:hypothetical protein
LESALDLSFRENDKRRDKKRNQSLWRVGAGHRSVARMCGGIGRRRLSRLCLAAKFVGGK